MKKYFSLQRTKKFIVRDSIAGNVIEYFNSLEEAKKCIKLFEIQDKREGIYTPNFYEIYDTEKEEIIL